MYSHAVHHFLITYAILNCHAGFPYGGPGHGILINGEFGGAGHGGNGGGDSSLSHGNSYGLTDTDLYLGGSTGIKESLTASLISSILVFMCNRLCSLSSISVSLQIGRPPLGRSDNFTALHSCHKLLVVTAYISSLPSKNSVRKWPVFSLTKRIHLTPFLILIVMTCTCYRFIEVESSSKLHELESTF